MEKHRRVRQQVETSLRNTKDSTAGRLLAKVIPPLTRKALQKAEFQSMTPQPMMRKSSILHFPPSLHLSPQEMSPSIRSGRTRHCSTGPGQEPLLTLLGQDKIGIMVPTV